MAARLSLGLQVVTVILLALVAWQLVALNSKAETVCILLWNANPPVYAIHDGC